MDWFFIIICCFVAACGRREMGRSGGSRSLGMSIIGLGTAGACLMATVHLQPTVWYVATMVIGVLSIGAVHAGPKHGETMAMGNGGYDLITSFVTMTARFAVGVIPILCFSVVISTPEGWPPSVAVRFLTMGAAFGCGIIPAIVYYSQQYASSRYEGFTERAEFWYTACYTGAIAYALHVLTKN